ncbi:MAG: hypothetical protein ACRDYX_21430 [Egibacteraceae bacterium]
MNRRHASRYCRSCGTRLAGDHTESRCGPCQRKANQAARRPPQVPPAFWETAELREAFASRHLGRIVRAYRHHRFHEAHPLPQQVVAGWMRLTQTQLSRIETGPAVSDLGKLTLWAQTLGMPQQYLWFDLPGQSRNGHGLPLPSSSKVDAAVDLHDLFGLEPQTANDRPVDEAYVESVKDGIGWLLALDNQFGGDDISGLAVRFFWSVHRRVGSDRYGPGVARDLRAVVGELGEVAGWLLYDADQQAAARQLNQEALLHARLAGDRAMQLLILQNMSMQAVYLNRPREALDLAKSVLEAGRLSTRVNTLFIVRKARALAQSEKRDDALDAFAQARALFLDGVADNDPPWVWWVDEAELAWHEAMCHADFDDWKRATDLFQQAVPEGCRSRFHSLAHLLGALVHVGAWRDAEAVIGQILPYVGEVGSTRTARLLHTTTTRIAGLQAPVGLRDAAEHLQGSLKAVGYKA